MYINPEYVHTIWVSSYGKATFMATAKSRSHKHFQLDSVKIKRAQKALRARTETEAIERALDLVIAEHENFMPVRLTTTVGLWSAWSEILTGRSVSWCLIAATGLKLAECLLAWRPSITTN